MERAISEYQKNQSVHYSTRVNINTDTPTQWLIHARSELQFLHWTYWRRRRTEADSLRERERELWSVRMELRSSSGAAMAVFVLVFSSVLVASVSASSRMTEIAADGELLRRNLLANGLGVTPPMGWVLGSTTISSVFRLYVYIPLFSIQMMLVVWTGFVFSRLICSSVGID